MRNVLAAVLLLCLAVPELGLAQAKSGKHGPADQLSLFDEVFQRVRHDAVEPVPDRKLIAAAIAGMLAGLDARSAYFSEAELARSPDPTEAEDGAVLGLVLASAGGELKVIAPRAGSPAAVAGVRPGDAILAIDEQPVDDMSLGEAEEKLRGSPGTAVKLTLERGAAKPFDLSVERAPYRLRSVAARVEQGNIGYVRLAGFDDATAAALAAALADLRQQAGNRLIGLILDMRDNPGGEFDAAVAAADAFLDKGDVAIIKGRRADDVRHLTATPGDLAPGLPIVALVNGGTAREAEMVAGALQDNRRAVLLGTKTFGDSAIESLIRMPGNGAIRIATARFLTPTGRAIQGKGLAPDLVVAPLALAKVSAAMALREADLRGALKNPDASETPPAAATVEPDSGHDEQLIQAIDVLNGFAVANGHSP